MMMITNTKTMKHNKTKDMWITKKNVTPEIREQVIEYWKLSKDNGSQSIANRFGLTVYMVNGILDNHLKNRTFENVE